MRRRGAIQKLAEDSSSEAVPLLVSALDSTDHTVRETADRALHSLEDPKAIDALCEEAIRNPSGRAAAICRETNKRPSDHERACLFLFVTRQLDAYFDEDFEFQNLRLQYDREDAVVQGHLMDIVRSGDRRCLGFFGARKSLSECTESEIQLAIDSALRHQDWPRLFRAFLELPVKYGYPLLDPFRDSGWEPSDPELKSVYKHVLEDSRDQSFPVERKIKTISPVFERWLIQGRENTFKDLSETELLNRLESCTPPEGVSIVAALAAKCKPGSETAQKIQRNPHWLIRLAGYATGLCFDLTVDEVKDSNYWVRELVTSSAVLELWPGKATPTDLDALKAAPREAWLGKFGAVRKVLQTLIGYRITTGVYEEMAFEAGEFAGEFDTAMDFNTDDSK
ncbi:MAG: HEAT repeat domain-containing protein [bacterium]